MAYNVIKIGEELSDPILEADFTQELAQQLIESNLWDSKKEKEEKKEKKRRKETKKGEKE